jgi:hypothetical protein
MLRVVSEFDKHFTSRGIQPNQAVKVRSVTDMDLEEDRFPEKEMNQQNTANIVQLRELDMIAVKGVDSSVNGSLEVVGTKNHIYVNQAVFNKEAASGGPPE